ncbi:MAG TPA: VTT domain-containing protein [Geminicoccus sp.]|jgi:uncharacterized membrane protein YdjX (TVP38/TMEM64 family)|uniref:TVP38/TMEM64 family protein n=1 Tax=Geminicoccus sp. TaxID=2024832 RepID=UPI002E30C85B|nr:VTT domain-containing protein [Geminicoccus sp.]HEX2528484.1 VTT domain-containing protein [Geminicoccus sp.]
MKRILPFGLLVLVGLIGFAFLGDLDGETLERYHRQFGRMVEAYPLAAPLVAVLVYAVVVAGFLPIALWVTLACGFAFGTFWGGVLSVMGATIGAVVTFLAARSSLGRPLHQWAGPRLYKLEKGLADDAWSYLMVLRMVPAFPFWLVNIVPALLRVPLSTFVITTALGIAPATFVLASIGSGLARVFAEGGSPDLSIMTEPDILLPLLAVSLLALVPAAWRHLRPGAGGL